MDASQTEWHADVTFALDTNELTDQQQDRLSERCHGVVFDGSTGTLTLTFEPVADDLPAAAKAAQDQALGALDRAAITGRAVGLDCLTMERYLERALTPDVAAFLDLIGTAETAAILDVSTPRIAQLARDHADFPKPVVNPASGPLRRRSEVEQFGRTWDRKRTGRPRMSA